MKKIVIPGGSGFLGKALSAFFVEKGWEVVIFTRGAANEKGPVTYINWDAQTFDGAWTTYLEGADLLVNLVGRTVNCRYSEKNKAAILESRTHSTAIIGEAILLTENPPKVWMNSSSATIYRHSEDKDMNEYTGEIGNDFSMNVCKEWEAMFNKYVLPQTRKVVLRTAITIGGQAGGAFTPLKNLVKLGLGGKQGKGNQSVSWVHVNDFCESVFFLAENGKAEGVFNIVAPDLRSNEAFMKSIRKTYAVPFGLPQPKWLLNIGARIIQTEPELILKSRRAVPQRLQEFGFQFKFPTLESALTEIKAYSK